MLLSHLLKFKVKYIMNTIGSKNIINEDIYNPISLKNHIDKISDSKISITDQDIVNLLLKYFFAHKNPESSDIKVKLSEIEELFSLAEMYFYSWKSKSKVSIHTSDDKVASDIKHIEWSAYWLAMLWDIAPSVVIFKNIVNKIITPDEFDWKYFWLDLGSWTGWLLLAQYIQAKRNWFSDIKNLWIEIIESTSVASNILASKLQIWQIIIWDTTVDNTYLQLPQDRILSYVSNENIPTNWVKMCWANDPFHQNNMALFSWPLKLKISELTQFFPHKINMLLDLWDEFKKEFIWEKSNGFWFLHLLEFEKVIKQLEQNWDMTLVADGIWNIFKSTYLTWIDMGNWEVIRLDEIWDKLLSKWLVNRLPWWRKRWE